MSKNASADLVIVGAGSAGSVIAARASEGGARSVLLLEAGPDYDDVAALPRDLLDGTRNSVISHDWGFTHSPTARQIPFDYPRGKVVGGSSAVNTCIALRGLPHDYDEWAERGLEEWSFDRCLPAFKRLENDLDRVDEWHGQDGPIPIRRHTPDELVPWQAAFVEAARELGFRECADHNNPTLTGVGAHPMNKLRGIRMSAARCYLTPQVRARENLRIVANVLVERVLFENRRVVGIQARVNGERCRFDTSRVLLCAGAIASPGILLRSGIGPERSLSHLKISMVSQLPAVAARLLDHPGSAMLLAPKASVCELTHPLIQTVLRYTSQDSAYIDDMQLQPGSLLPLTRIELPIVTLMCCVGKPSGAGRIEFNSADPESKPKITSDFARHPQDLARAAEAMELAALFASTKPMRQLATLLWPAQPILSKRQLVLDWLPKASGSGYHPCGTVPMGPEGDAESAVDGRGRVRGVQGLFVADASIMPTIPTYNINLPTLMIGERFGEWIQKDEL
ncbi:MAG TPA: GMC family oxidoreductase N-terminal domain-containing protein [Polyangiaceae bacterium]|nr:GMC family oxidoreductase N-terminal domain-containing protein [Polyangiaceae bacterium]